jgi:predicted dehydrogenase
MGADMEQRKMKIGVVGANGGADRWGARAHLPAVLALEEATLAAVCTSREETARNAQQRSGAERAYWDYREMMRSPDIDLVTIAVRIAMHQEIALAALEAGKHVFCEWPLALDTAQARTIARRAQHCGVRHAVGTQSRFSPGIMYGKELMEEAYVGRPLLFHMTHFLSHARDARPSHRRWTVRAEEGGGAILIALGHALDVVRWYLGEVSAVSAATDTLVREVRFADTGEVVPATAIDTVSCQARLDSGITGTMHVSMACARGSGFRLEVHGTEGRLLVESPHMVQYSPARVFGSRGAEALRELPVPQRLHEVSALPADGQALHVAQLLRGFMRAIRDGAAFHPNFDDAVSLHATIDAIKRAAGTGAWEQVA